MRSHLYIYGVNQQQKKEKDPGFNQHFNLTIYRLDLDEEKSNQIDEGPGYIV